ncbi:MAG TPA: outer membrane beta-barrel protein, partial [Rhodopila sp.]|nr:outer membrane beta-barrel protein [Rhodopila sp.]
FPDGVPGYGTDDGVTVQTRLHPEQMPLGVREGAFVFTPQLDQGYGYTSNALPGPYRRGSLQLVTSPSLGVASDWSRDAFGALVSVQDTRYLSLPSQSRTDATVSAGGRVDIGNDKLTVAAAHIAAHEDRSQLDTVASDRPIAFDLDDVRASYAINDGRWSIVPNVHVTNWTYDSTTLLGIPASQAYRNRLVTQGGVSVRYEFAPLRSVMLVVRAVDQEYTRTPAGQPSPDSTAYQVLAGVDYDDDAVWHLRALVGGESRRFSSPLYPQQNTLIAEASAAWSPSGLTTVTATVGRDTEDAEQEGVSGLIYSSARLTIDHEYLRNLLFRASIGLQRADFFQGGHQVGATAGLGITWVMNRNTRLLFTYDQTDLHGSTIPTDALVTGYSRGIGLMTLRLGL